MPHKDKGIRAKYQREYRRKHKEEIKAYRKAYYEENRERLISKS